jgi:hypothetical protein
MANEYAYTALMHRRGARPASCQTIRLGDAVNRELWRYRIFWVTLQSHVRGSTLTGTAGWWVGVLFEARMSAPGLSFQVGQWPMSNTPKITLELRRALAMRGWAFGKVQSSHRGNGESKTRTVPLRGTYFFTALTIMSSKNRDSLCKKWKRPISRAIGGDTP